MSEQGRSKRQCEILKRQHNAHTIKPLQGEKNEGRYAPVFMVYPPRGH